MGKRRTVPEILWRLYRGKARTLADTILALVPRRPISPEDCQCVARGCLRCSTDKMSFLLRLGDPLNYRKLLRRCFVVIGESCPPLHDFCPASRSSQREIVEKTIRKLTGRRSAMRNVLCVGYDKHNQASPAVESLTDSAWDILLGRIGDQIMIYLLEQTSILLPLLRKRHQQVAGPPINLELKRKSEHQDCTRKRKREDDSDTLTRRRQKCPCKSGDCPPFPSASVCCNGKDSKGPSRLGCRGKNDRSGLPVVATRKVVASSTQNQEISGKSSDNVRNNSIEIQKKRSRPLSWQRRKKLRQSNIQESGKTSTTSYDGDDTWHKGFRIEGENLQVRLDLKANCLSAKIPGPHPCSSKSAMFVSVSKDMEIDRRYMFYNLKTFLSVLPQKHILNIIKADSSGLKSLMKDIFGDVNILAWSTTSFNSSGPCPIGVACLFHSLLKSLKILIRRSKWCQHLRLLDKHCPISLMDLKAIKSSSSEFLGNDMGDCAYEESHYSRNKIEEKTGEYGKLVKSYCLRKQVVSFIWAVLRCIVPSDLLGTKSNWRVLTRNIARFIGRTRYEKVSLKQCMHNLKTSRFPVFSDKQLSCCLFTPKGKCMSGHTANLDEEQIKLSSELKNALCTKWISWLFSQLVVSLVLSNFYVTESQHGKQDIYYYRKSVWENLSKEAIAGSSNKFVRLDDAIVRDIQRSRTFGFSKLRLLPKQNGVRMVANLNSMTRLLPSEHGSGRRKSVNSVLRDLHVVLKGLQPKESEKLGSSVFAYDDVYRRLCPFLVGLKSEPTHNAGLYVVVADVSKAFDSILQNKLLKVMQDVIVKDKYQLQRSTLVCCAKRSTWVSDAAVMLDKSNSYTGYVSSTPFHTLHSIIIDQGQSQDVTKEKLFSCLTELVKRNILEFDKALYLQRIGIPQGSILSTLLCSLYYGHLERKVIYPFLEATSHNGAENLPKFHKFPDASAIRNNIEDEILPQQKYILLRFIDDFLFISTSKEQAANFFSRLQKGFQEYNCYMNDQKFCLNFNIEQKSGICSTRMYKGKDGISFIQWSGLLINCCTLEFQADYTRYLPNHLNSTLTVPWHDKPVHHLKTKMRAFMRPKCHPLLFDSNINSASVVRLNVYQVFLLSAMKFHCYVLQLSCICKLHPGSHRKLILGSIRYMYKLMRRRMHTTHSGCKLRPILRLDKREVTWLGLHAFAQALKKKQSRYTKLLRLLRKELAVHELTGNLSPEMKYAIDAAHSSALWDITY